MLRTSLRGQNKRIILNGVNSIINLTDVTPVKPTNLNSLIVNGTSAQLSPTFNRAITSYILTVPRVVSAITVTVIAMYDLATIHVNGISVSNHGTSGTISLNIGENIVTVRVSIPNDTEYTDYVVNINRT